MRFFGTRRAVVSAVLAGPLFLFGAPALASESLEINDKETVYLSGTVHYKSVVVHSGGVLRVRPMKDGEPGTGWLILKASTVTVELGGTIDATGAGYSGTNGDGDACSVGSGGAAGPNSGVPAPGSGGANAGAGAAGCPNGGTPSTPSTGSCQEGPGAAGGAAFVPGAGASAPNHGGNGGGALQIIAAQVHVNGQILAEGQAGFVYSSVGTGGGAGGFVSIQAAVVDGNGRISAKGGDGGEGLSGHGGGGGGGLLRVVSALPLASDGMGGTLPSVDVGPGKSGTCLTAQAGVPDLQTAMDPCIDVDGDGETAEECGGDDCDDSDERIKGGSDPALEVCDGADNDCDGDVDDDLVKDACPAGQSCQSGECTADGAGGTGGGAGVAPPDYLEYRGACALDSSSQRSGLALSGAALLAALTGLIARLRGRRR